MKIESTLEANTKIVETREPGIRAFGDPSMSSEPLAAFDAAAGDASLDAAPTLFRLSPPQRSGDPRDENAVPEQIRHGAFLCTTA